MPLFGVHTSRGEESEFYAVVADDEHDAEKLVYHELCRCDDVRLEVSNLEALLNEQYEGLAVLVAT